MDPIDNVSRDSKDGSYRCPQCQTPFTRRSNLRRHFQIHLRGTTTSLKCEVCNEEHSTKDSLQDHVANSHSPTWNVPVSHEKPLRRSVIPQDITSHSPFATMSPPPSYGPSSSQSTSNLSQYPNLVSSAPSRPFQVPNFGRLNFSTSGSSSPLSTAAIPPLARSTSSMTSDRRTPMVGSPPSLNPFPHRRTSTPFSSISSEPSISPSLPYTRMGHPDPQQGHYGLYPAPPSSTPQEWLAEIMEQQQGFNGDELPIYTRQDVKKMLDVVSDCFVESVERVLNANGQHPPNPARLNHNHSTTLDTGVRQMILSEAIPRLISRLQGNDDDVNSHAGGGC